MVRLALGAGLAVVALTALLLARSALLPSRQIVAEAPAQPERIDAAAAADRLAGALKIPTISRQGTPMPATVLADFHRYLEASFPRVHQALRREILAGASVLYTWAGRDPSLPPVLLLGHFDVVPVEAATESAWTHPPFGGAVADGFIWGRGALDMKLAVVGQLEAIDGLLAAGFTPARTVLLAFGHDEEIGGASGAASTAALLKARGVHPLLILDEGLAVLTGIVPGVGRPVATVGIAEKGYLSVELTAHAEGGHASMPPARTAAGALADAIRAIERQPFAAHLDGPAELFFDFLAPELPWNRRVVLTNRWLFSPVLIWQLDRTPPTRALVRTTAAVTMLEGSPKENILPQRARAVVNVRIHPADDSERALAELTRRVNDRGIEIRPLRGASAEPSALSPVTTPAFERLQRTIAEVFPEAIVAPTLVMGATDSRHYAGLTDAIYRFLPVTLGPEDTVRIHGTDERVTVAAYRQAVTFYMRIIRNTAGL